MSDSEKCESSSSVEKSKKKMMNVQTQHGNEQNADEENIVVLSKLFQASPTRDADFDAVVWHEEFESSDQENVSTHKKSANCCHISKALRPYKDFPYVIPAFRQKFR